MWFLTRIISLDTGIGKKGLLYQQVEIRGGLTAQPRLSVFTSDRGSVVVGERFVPAETPSRS